MHQYIEILFHMLTTFTGDESSAVVEVAPYQGIPKDGRRRKDLKNGTIFKGFLFVDLVLFLAISH